MRNIVLVLTIGLLVGCGTVGIDTPMGKTGWCLKQADELREAIYLNMETGMIVSMSDADVAEVVQRARNECWWAKGDRKN